MFGATVHSDASAALGIVNRTGLGKLRHLNVQFLWVQNRAAMGDMKITKVPGKDNPADLMTKHLPAAEIEKHCEELSMARTGTRAETAPSLHALHLRQSVLEIANELQVDEASVEEALKGQSGATLEGRDGRVAVVHRRPLASLYLPSRLGKTAPKEALTGYRESHVKDVVTGETTVVRDNWTSGKVVDVGFNWVGWTLFRRHGASET